MVRPSKLALIAAFAALYIVWGSTYLGIRFAIQSIPPLLMAGARFLFAGAILYGAARASGAPRPVRADWGNALVIGASLLFIGNGGVTIAEQFVPSSMAALMVATVPMFIAILGWSSGLSPRPSLLVGIGLLGGFAGVGLLMMPALTLPAARSHHGGAGMLLLLLASLFWSAGSLYSRTVKNAPPPFLAAGQQMLCGGVLLLVTSGLAGEFRHFDPARVSLLSWVSFCYLVIVGALLGFTTYIWLLRHCSPSKVATYAYVNPVIAVLLGAAFAGETLGLPTIVAAGLIVGSVALVITSQSRKGPGSIAPEDCGVV